MMTIFALSFIFFFFFFQAEDGIRDKLVTGVQTCALPISKMVDAGTAMVTASTATSAPKWRVRRVVSMAGAMLIPLDMRRGLSGGTTGPDGDLGPATGGRLGRRGHPPKERPPEEPGGHISAPRVVSSLLRGHPPNRAAQLPP